MLLASTAYESLGIIDAGVLSLVGYAVVFFGLILLQLVIMLVGKAFTQKKEAAPVAEAPVQSAPAPVAAPATVPVSTDAAPGSAGKLKLHDVPPKTAAMLMAIVADKMGKPLNELRFISIKEVK